MPIICEFFGIKIYIYWNEHTPPYFHAEYKAQVDIEKAVVIKSFLPSRQLKLVLAWCEIHEHELQKNWIAAQEHRELIQIEPLH